jgi:hypothetical protein
VSKKKKDGWVMVPHLPTLLDWGGECNLTSEGTCICDWVYQYLIRMEPA